jgi:hypothetical protein
MADFDKDLQPIIKPSGYKATNIPIGPGMNFSTPGGGGVSDLSQKEDVFSELAAAGQKFSQKGLFISNAELEANKRYKTFNPTIGDYEDFAAQGQEWYKQATNGVLKGANLAATTIAGGFGMLYGVGKAVLFTQKLSDVWDNEINRGLQKWNEKVDNEFLPNYYTAAERNAEWYSTDNWFTTNFLFDKLIKNSGYAVGAMVGGNIANAGLLKLGSTLGNALAKGATAVEASQAFKLFTPLLRNTSRAFSAGKNKEAAALLESKISSIADLSAKASQMANISKQTGQFARFSDAARRTAVATYSSAGEASFEALHTAKEYRDNLIDEYTIKNGYEPTGEELKNIDLQAEKVGKTSFFGNMALLSITEFNQLPYLIGSSYGPSRQAINSLLGRVDNAAVDDALKGIKAAPKTKFGKIYEGTRRAGVYVFDPKESMQEILQYGLQVGTQNYFKKSEQGGEADLFVDGFLYGLFGKDEFGEGVGAFVSKEGIEGGILGGITGAVMQARGNYQERKALAKNTENFLNMLENAPTFKEVFQDKLDGTNRGVVLQQQERDAILNGDKLEAIDLRVDGIHNYLAPRIKYGRFDMVMDDLNELKQSGMTESGLAELKEQGMANINDDVNSFQKRITSIENAAKNLNDMYQSLNIRYAGETIEVDGEERRKYSPITIDKLAYAASKIANYDVRIPQLNGNLINAGINTQAILNDIIATGTPNAEATKEALETINSMNVTSDVKDELKGQLDDVIELSLRRKMFIEEYDSIKNNPLNYERPEKEVDKVDILQKEGRKKLQKTLEVGKEYSLTDPISLEKGKLILAPKFTVLSSTLGGEFEVLLPDGTTTFFSPDQFNKYSLTEETNTSQEMEDALNQAIDDVLNYPAFKNVVKKPEEGVNKLSYVNSLGNQKFTKAIINRFNKLTEALREAKAKEKEAADKLKEQKEDIDKQQNDVANQPGDPSVDEIQFDTRIDSGETGPLKAAAKFFNSSSNESDDPNYKFYNPNPAPHIIRSRVFLNNAKNNKKRDKFRAITFTYNQENDLGLSGITELSYGKNWEANKNKVNDLINGFVAQVYVEVEGKNRYFIDKNGDRIKNAQGQDIKVGEQVDLSKVIFETRPTAVEYSSADGDRFRTNEKDEFLRNMEIWKRQREILLGNPAENIAPMAAKDLPTNSFIISKGFAITTPKVDGKYVKNKVGETLVQESQISTQSGLLKISTGDNIIHSGETMKAKLGLVYLQFRDTLQVLNNNILGAKKGKVVYEVIKSLINDMQSQALSGKPVSLDRQKLLYLRSVLNYAKPTAEMSSNQLWIDIESMSIKLGNKSFSFSDFINKEAESVSALANTYHAANKRTLDKGQSYLEFVFEDGKLSTVKWPNYQSYLISGKNRNIDEIPFVTNVAKTSDAIPYNFRGKYATVQNFSVGEKNTDFNDPTQQQAPPAPPAAPPAGKSEANSASDPPPSLPAMKIGNFNINDGSTNTVQVGKQKVNTVISKGEIVDGKLFIEVSFDFDDPVNQTAVQNIQNNPAFKSTYFASWKSALPELNDDSTEEETIGAYFRNEIKAQLLDAFNAQQAPPTAPVSDVEETKTKTETPSSPPAEEPTSPPKSKKGRFKSGYDDARALSKSEGEADKISQRDIEVFKAWHAKNAKTIPFEILDNIITLHDGRKAWGVFENGVAKFFKSGLRGTEYHEIFEGIWKGFLSENERQIILEEFKNKPGDFLDRESGRRILFSQATDRQAKERIADDFADYRVGKLPARNLSERIRRFFKAIVDFFKSFVNKPSLKDELFKAIDSGRFREAILPESVKVAQPEYRKEMVIVDGSTLFEDEAYNFVQDMAISIAGYILNRENDNTVENVFEFKKVTGTQAYNFLRDKYTEVGNFEQIGEKVFNELYLRTVDQLRIMGISIDAESIKSINDGDGNNRLYSPEAFEVDFKKNMKFAIKFLISSLPAAEKSELDESGLPALKKGAIGLNVLSNVNRNFATLLSKLSDTSLEKIPEKLYELYKEDGNYYRLVRALRGDMSAENPESLFDFENFKDNDWKLYIQFTQAFNKSKPNSFVESRNKSIDGISVVTKPAEKASAINVVKYNWLSNVKQLSTEGGSMIKRKKLSYFIDVEHPNYPNKLPKPDEDGIAQRLEFLKNIGINFPASAIPRIVGEESKERNKFIKAVNDIYNYGSKNLADSGNFTNADGAVMKLAELYVNSLNPDHDTTRLNVENKRTGNYSDSNAVSVFEEIFNESKSIDELLQRRPELRDVYSKNSVILKKGGYFFDENGDKIEGRILKVGVVDGINENDGGTTITSLTKGERFTLEINQNLRGEYYILIPADSSTERTLNVGNNISFADTNTEAGDKEFFEIMKNYLNDEIELALDWRNRKQLAAIGETRAKQLRMFREILDMDLVDQIEKVVADGRLSKDGARKKIEKILKDNSSKIETSFKSTVEYLNNKLDGDLKSTGQVMNVSPEMVEYPYLDNDFIQDNKIDKNEMSIDDYNKLLSFINMNQMIASIEIHKFIFGDPYQFKTTAEGNLEATKRFKSWLSPRRKTFDSQAYNDFLNDDYNKTADGQDLPGDDITRYKFRSSVTTVTLTDPKPISRYIDRMKEYVDYEGYDESDGFSLIQIGAYREVKLKNAEWPKEAETWYQWQMAYTRQKMSGLKKADGKAVYSYGDNTWLKKHDEELIKKREPYYVLEVLKPIVSGVKPNLDRIEGDIDKYSQMPVFFKAVEGTALQDLYVQMLEQETGYVVYKSGRKEGARGTHNLYKNGKINTDNFGEDTIEEIAWSTYGIQVDNTYEEDKNQTRVSQLMKNASMDMFQNGKEVMPGAAKIVQEIESNHDEYHQLQYDEFLEKLGIKDLGTSFKIVDAKKVSETLEYELLRREASENTIDTIRLDESGKFRIPFEASSAYEEIQRVLYSIINKSLISPSMEGKPYVQVPATGWENKEEGRELIRRIKTADGFKYEKVDSKQYEAMSEEDKKTVYLASSKLKFYENEDGKRHMEVMIPNYWKKYFKGMSDEEVLKYLNKKENQKILFGVGARIPHQAMSSTEIFKVVGFLHPSMGSTIVVPSEIVKKAGSDFDIDKLNTYLKAVYLDADGNVKLVEYKGSKQATLDFYDKVFYNVASKEAEQILDSREFMDQLYEFFDVYEDVENASELEPYDLKLALGEEQFAFYAKFKKTITNTINRASEKGMSPLDHLNVLMAKSAGRFEKLTTKQIYDAMKDDFVKQMYKKSLENRYYELLQQLVTLPENFSRLMTPVSDAGLPAVAKELDKARGESEGSVKHKLLSKSFLTSLRHAFTIGKKWVGIVAVNITGHAIAQRINAYIDPARLSKIDKYDASFLGDMSLVVPHNTVTVDGEDKIALGGRNTAYSRKDKKGEPVIEFISDRLSGYASAVVDVAKDPFIMRILNSDLVVGTAMFMERIGAGELTPFFLNQPIIIDYLKYLDKIGNRALFSDTNITQMYEKYPISAGKSYDLRNDFPIDPETKLVNFAKSKARLLSSIDINAKRDEEFNLKQHAVFKEFLKVAKMAQYSFKFTQAYNYDTTRVRTTEGVLRKALRTDIAEEANIISSVNDVFKKTFIGKQREMIIKEVKSLSAIFKLDNDVFYNIIDEVLKPFASQEYMSLDDFDRVVKKVKTGMIDYLVQTKSPVFSKSIITNLISGQNNIGKQLSTLQKKYPKSELLSNFETRFSKYEEGAVTVTMKAKPSDAATTNRYIAMMRELKALEPEFYKNLVLVSLLQGTYDTRIAINKIVPLEDRAEIIAPLINATYSQADLQNFSRQGVFFRTNFSDSSIVPEYTPKFLVKEGQFGYERTGFIKLDGTDSTPGNGRVLRLSKAYSRFNNAEMDFLKVKRYQYAKGYIFDITGERKPIRWRLTKGETGIDFATLVQNGEVNQYEMVGYKKVKDSSGEPLTDEKDNVYFKMVNLYGDGDLVKLYRVDGLPSTIKNNTYPVKQELSDDTIIKAVNNEIISSPERIIEQPTEVSQQSSQVYSQLGNKTQSENIVISNIKTKDGKYDREANIKEAQENNRIYSMETNSNLSFSNPWASFKRGDTINTSTTKEAVQNYIDWLITDKFKDIKPERRAWILNQLKLGSLKGKTIQYYAELNEPSHATALDYLINKYDWSTVTQPTVETSQAAGQPSTPTTSTSNKVERSERIINRSELRANPKTLYLFGDNDVRKGLGGQAREMRNEPNAIGISTKKLPATSEQSYKTDAELESNKTIITNDINKAIAAWDSGKYNKLVIPPMGVGLAELPTRAPQTYEFLQQELQRLENHVNGVRQPTTPTTPEQVVPETPIVETVLDTKVDNFRYYGAPYQIVLDVDGKPINVVGYRGSKSKMQAILDAYLENPNVDPQNKKPFRKESGEALEEVPESGNTFTFSDGVSIDTGNIILNSQQQKALQLAVDAINKNQSKFVLRGYAGTGKSTISKFVKEYVKKAYEFKEVKYSSPTHKANTNLLIQLIRGKIFGTTPVTVAKLLNKTKVDGKFVSGPRNKMPYNGVLIVDESSMIDNQDYGMLMKLAEEKSTTVIFMGDPAQLPPVNSPQISSALQFKSEQEGYELTQVMRQQGDNSLLDILTTIRQNLTSVTDKFSFKTNINEKGEGVEFTKDYDGFIQKIMDYFSSPEYKDDPTYAKILTYTNSSVANYNSMIQNKRGLAPYAPGSILMGYEQVGDMPTVHNGQDYVVLSNKYVANKPVQVFSGNVGNKSFDINGEVSGFDVTLRRVFSKEDEQLLRDNKQEALLSPINVFIINPIDERNIKFMERVLAFKKVLDDKTIPWRLREDPLSKLESFFGYYQLPADIISYKGQVTTLNKLKEENPKLFRVNKDTGRSEFEELNPTEKPMLPKNIDYGYAVTSHKGQGSTYKYIFVDYQNMENPANDRMIKDGSTFYAVERQQLKYVGLSRASKIAYVFTRKADGEVIPSQRQIESSKSGNLGFDSTLEFSEKEKTTIVSNFANKHKMTTEEARKYLNDAFAKSDAKSVIDKLKECYL